MINNKLMISNNLLCLIRMNEVMYRNVYVLLEKYRNKQENLDKKQCSKHFFKKIISHMFY